MRGLSFILNLKNSLYILNREEKLEQMQIFFFLILCLNIGIVSTEVLNTYMLITQL